jgi:RHS repeat-associated protein
MKMPQENGYSSFGGFWGEGTSNTNQAYKYNGKELDRIHGLDWYDYGARNYDAALPVWATVDPLADHPKQAGMSPYSAFANNPIRYVSSTEIIWGDAKQAERLNKSINKRIESIDKNTEKIQAKI